jgi:hypothetical protein
MQQEDAVIGKRGGTTLNVRLKHVTVQTIDQQYVQLGREGFICKGISLMGCNTIPALGMEDGLDLEESLWKALGISQRRQYRSQSQWGRIRSGGDRGSRHGEDHAAHCTCRVSCIQNGCNDEFVWNNR